MSHVFRNPITSTLSAFVNSIGLRTQPAHIAQHTFLPGLHIADGTILIDESRLLFPGDILHEAGHLAVTPSERRDTLSGNAGADAGEEMMAIAWSYAAAVHLGVDLALVFHPDGYRGGSQAILENFAHGRYVGVPLLQWLGMTADTKAAKELNVAPYPHMLKWLRD
jgi:hypothetical protein